MSEGGWGIDDESKSKSNGVFYLTFSSLLPSRCSKVIPPRMQYPTTQNGDHDDHDDEEQPYTMKNEDMVTYER